MILPKHWIKKLLTVSGMNRKIWLIGCIFLSGIMSCGKKTVSTSSPASLSTALAIEDVDFDYLTSSSKIRYSDDGKNVSATANVRIKKDSVIWISVTPGFGIEAARALVTRDSLAFINRLEKEYQAYSFQELSDKFNFNINYDLLQAVFLGDMPRTLAPEDEVKQQAEHFLVQQQEGPLTITNFINARLMKVDQVAVVDQTKRASQNGKRTKNTLNLRYEDFEKVDDQLLPFKNELSLDYRSQGKKRRTQIDIQHKKANIVEEALQFPFSIPDKYARK